MPRIDLKLITDIARSPRVKQTEGIFDVPESKTGAVEYHFNVPWEERDWQIGLIHGPSGAGKSSVARELFGDNLVEGHEWSKKVAVVDGFGDLGIRDITKALSSVGFSSPPAWVKPFEVLSNGEKFRADLARCITDDRPLIAVDEFTSVVDRTVAKIGSHAVAKAIRSKKDKRFVAVSCHDDIIEWLQPDWTLEPHIGRFHWRSVQQRPDIAVEYVRVRYDAWSWFAPHHYLTAKLNRGAVCIAALVEGQVAGFIGIIHQPNVNPRIKRISRTVVLPDYQGIGLAVPLMDFGGAICKALNFYCHAVTAHPALQRALAHSENWKMIRKPALGIPHSGGQRALNAGKYAKHRKMAAGLNATGTTDRRTASFRYVGPAEDEQLSGKLMMRGSDARRLDLAHV